MEIARELLDQFPTTLFCVCAVMSTIFLFGIMQHLQRIVMLLIVMADKDGLQEQFRKYLKDNRSPRK